MHNSLTSTLMHIKLNLWTWSNWLMHNVHCIYTQHSWVCSSSMVPLYVQNKSCCITMDPKSSDLNHPWHTIKYLHWCPSFQSKPTTTANMIWPCNCILCWKIPLTPPWWSPLSDCTSNTATSSFKMIILAVHQSMHLCHFIIKSEFFLIFVCFFS